MDALVVILWALVHFLALVVPLTLVTALVIYVVVVVGVRLIEWRNNQ